MLALRLSNRAAANALAPVLLRVKKMVAVICVYLVLVK